MQNILPREHKQLRFCITSSNSTKVVAMKKLFYTGNCFLNILTSKVIPEKEAAAIGIMGIPDEETITMLEKEWGKPTKKIE